MAQIKEAPFIPNCCGRLYSILVQMKKKEGRTRSAIASVLRNGESSKDADLFAAAAELRALVDECSAAVEKHLEHTEMYTPALTKIVSVFHVIDLSSASSPLFVSSLNETDLVTLWHTARQLQLVLGAEPSPQADEWLNLVREIQGFSRDVLIADLDAETKSVLNDLAQAIETALVEAKLRGPRGVKRAVEAAIGAIIMNQELFEKPEAKAWADKLLEQLKTIGAIARSVGPVVSLAEKIHKAISA